ncbi:MAG TPA: hypothetical protein VKK81_16195 [Candidatus Binatia bacterium]|nr:hypothetical protein [Candidatus Binatia bacterium]
MPTSNKLQSLLTPDTPQEVRRQVTYHGEPIRLGVDQYEIRGPNGEVGIVTFRLPAVEVHWLNHSRESRSLTELLNLARRGALPAWVGQIPVLAERLRAVFDAEIAKGINPHVRIGISGDEVFHEDLCRGVRHSRKLSELLDDLGRGRRLPAIYDTPAIRAALGLES